jgi:uncharacterized membrane protein
MKFLNEADGDRAARIVGGILLLVAGWTVSTTTLGIALLAVGAIAIATGIAGWCPAYTLFGFSTVKRQAASRGGERQRA